MRNSSRRTKEVQEVLKVRGKKGKGKSSLGGGGEKTEMDDSRGREEKTVQMN